MEKRTEPQAAATKGAGRPVEKVLAVSATAAALAFGILLGIRQLTYAENDLGYHLAYGEEFWDHGRLVDHNGFLYTLPPEGLPPDERPQPGPGCWYDAQGRYRFPNANWLTQVILAGAHRLGGIPALTGLRAALVAAIFILCLLSMRNLNVPPLAAAAGLLLIALSSWDRLILRPELFTYAFLAAQLCILTGWEGKSQARAALSWPRVAGLVLLQLALVNAHSYFLIGFVPTGAVLADRLLRMGWRSLSGRKAPPEDQSLRRQTVRLAAALGGQAIVCLANPWTWRVAVLPLQTLGYLKEHHVAQAGGNLLSAHPWSFILELRETFATGLPDLELTPFAVARLALLVLLAAAVIVSLARRRWSSLILVATLTLTALTVRRNVAVAAVLAVPVALAVLRAPAAWLGRTIPGPVRKFLVPATAVALALASVGLGFQVVTQKFYQGQGSANRFGLSWSPLTLPLEPAAWIETHRPVGRLWTDFSSSSNAYYFSGRRNDVCILSNTWAYPPEVMREVLRYAAGELPFDEACRKFSPQIVLLHVDAAPDLIRSLARERRWSLVCVEGPFVVFLRADGPNADLAARCRLTPDSLDPAAYRQRMERLDAFPASGLLTAAKTLFDLGWYGHAALLLEGALGYDRNAPRTWDLLGLAYLERADEESRSDPSDPRIPADLEKARQAFREELRLRPDSPGVPEDLGLIRKRLAEYRSR